MAWNYADFMSYPDDNPDNCQHCKIDNTDIVTCLSLYTAPVTIRDVAVSENFSAISVSEKKLFFVLRSYCSLRRVVLFSLGVIFFRLYFIRNSGICGVASFGVQPVCVVHVRNLRSLFSPVCVIFPWIFFRCISSAFFCWHACCKSMSEGRITRLSLYKIIC